MEGPVAGYDACLSPGPDDATSDAILIVNWVDVPSTAGTVWEAVVTIGVLSYSFFIEVFVPEVSGLVFKTDSLDEKVRLTHTGIASEGTLSGFLF